MALQDDIQAQIAKYKSTPYSTQNADSAVNGIDSQYTNSLLDSLAQLQNKYSGQQNTLQQQLGTAKVEGQDTLNQNAVDTNTLMKNIQEQMANYGSLGSGQYPVLQIQADAGRQNNDAKIYNQRTTDVGNINNSLNALQSTGGSDLLSMLSQSANARQGAVQKQQSDEAAAAQAEYDKQMALQNALLIAQGNNNASRYAANANNQPAAVDPSKVLTNANGLYTVSSTDPNTGIITKVVNNPTALLSYIANSGLAPEQQAYVISQYPAYVNGGSSLADYWSSLQNPLNGTQAQQIAVGRGRTQ
jgi:hypothetical protein